MSRVNVIDESGDIQTLPQSQLNDAIAQGYRVATQEELKSFSERQEFTSGAKPLLAGLAGAGRALTFGGSDVALTKSGLVQPDTLKKLEQYNPVASLAGEAGAIGASLLVPGYGEATAARGAAGAAARIATAPTRAATALGQAATRGAAEMLPAATAMGKMGQAAVSHGAGAALEGALYGAGRVVTEQAMGDPELNAESVMGHVGLAALLGGGLGSAIGITGAGLERAAAGARKLMPERPLPDAGPAIINTPKGKEIVSMAPEGTLERGMQEMGVDGEKIKAAMDGSRRLKPNAAEIIEESRIAGLTPMESQISSNKDVQRLQTMLLDRPGRAGEMQRAVFESNWSKAGKNFENALETGETRSAHELGQLQKEVLKEQIEAVYKPIQDRYKNLGPTAESILVPEQRRLHIIGDLLKKADTPSPNAAVGGPRKKLFEQWAERAQDQTTLGNFDGLYTEISNAERGAWRSSAYTEASVLNEIKTTLREFQSDVVDQAHLAFAKEAGMPIKEAKALAASLKAERAAAAKEYKKFVETVGDLAGVARLGKKKTYREIMEAIDKIEPSKLAENVFRGDRINALQKLQKDFPAAFDLFSVQMKKELLESAMKDGAVNPRLAAKKIMDATHGMPKEIQQMLFTSDDLAKMKGTKTWLEALPEDWAPSKTPRGMMYMEYFSSPLKAAASEVMGAAQAAYIKSSVQETSALIQLERAAKSSIRKLQAGAKAIFSERVSGFAAAKAAEAMISHEDTKKQIKRIREIANNPELMIEKLSKGVADIEGFAPQMSQGLQTTAVRAVQYLSAVAPETESPYPLGEPPEPSRRELNIFSEKMGLIKNPSSVLGAVKDGSLTPEHIEVLSTVYPRLYKSMQNMVMEEMVNAKAKKKPIPQNTKNMLSLFLNQDLDESITAQSILSNQMIMQRSRMESQAQEAQMGQPPQSSSKGLDKLDRSTQAMLPMQKSSQRMG